jgi:hypothetical protein
MKGWNKRVKIELKRSGPPAAPNLSSTHPGCARCAEVASGIDGVGVDAGGRDVAAVGVASLDAAGGCAVSEYVGGCVLSSPRRRSRHQRLNQVRGCPRTHTLQVKSDTSAARRRACSNWVHDCLLPTLGTGGLAHATASTALPRLRTRRPRLASYLEQGWGAAGASARSGTWKGVSKADTMRSDAMRDSPWHVAVRGSRSR